MAETAKSYLDYLERSKKVVQDEKETSQKVASLLDTKPKPEKEIQIQSQRAQILGLSFYGNFVYGSVVSLIF